MQVRHPQSFPSATWILLLKYLDSPLVPYTAIIGLAPHTDLHLSAVGNMHGILESSVSYRPMNMMDNKRTLSGKKIGNQLIISLLFSSMLTGLVDNSVLLAEPAYSTVSK